MIKIFKFLVVFVLCYGCASTNQNYTAVQLQKFNEIVEGKPFSVDSQKAFPRNTTSLNALPTAIFYANGSSPNMIDISSHTNVFKFNKDSISTGYLPYYGERQFTSNYGSTNIGIEFDSKITNYKTSKTKRNNHKIQFTVRDKNSNTESYDVTLIVFKNLRTQININSNHRFPIQYSGTVVN